MKLVKITILLSLVILFFAVSVKIAEAADEIVVIDADSVWSSDLVTTSPDVTDSTDAPSQNLITWAFVSHADSVWNTELEANIWKIKPDLAIKTPLEFFNDEPPFLPNVLKIKATITNEGNAKAENVIIKFALNEELLGEKSLGSLEPGQTTSTDVRWEAISNIENATITAEVIAVGQGEYDLSDNIISQPVSFYWIDSRYDPPGFIHNRDAFWFPNWGCNSYKECVREWQDFARSIILEGKESETGFMGKEMLFFKYLLALLGGPWYEWFKGVNGHCYGMSVASTRWWLEPSIKPSENPVFAMTETEAKPSIIWYHWGQSIYLLAEGLWEPAQFDAQEEYNEILSGIKSAKPVVLEMLASFTDRHSVTAYKLLDLGDQKRVYIYDNNYPLSDKKEDQYIEFRLDSNEANYTDPFGYRYIMVFATPLFGGSSETITIVKDTLVAWLREIFIDFYKENRILFRILSPVKCLVTDQQGRRIGYIDDTFINEIPGAKMKQQLDSQLFYLPIDLTYIVEMTGTDEGVLGLDYLTPISESRARVVIYDEIPITLGSKVTATLNAVEIPNEVVIDTGEVIDPKSTGTLDTSDIVPPAFTEDIYATNPETDSITLNWTAPGDDWDTGTATTYDIRYSTSPITEDTWDEAIQYEGEPIPQSAGNTEALVVNNLDWGTTYYFALKTADEIPNWSALSNIASEKTKTPATIDCDPDTLNLESKGKWITCYIELPEGYNAKEIDASAVSLNGISAYLGKEGWAKAEANESNIVDSDRDGILERMVKFDRTSLQGILEPGDEVTLNLTGKLLYNQDLADFEGQNTIKVIDKGGGNGE